MFNFNVRLYKLLSLIQPTIFIFVKNIEFVKYIILIEKFINLILIKLLT
jgi:hypothetical protein